MPYHIAALVERFGTALMGTLERLRVRMSPSVRGEVASAVLHDERCLPYSPAVICGAWQPSPHLHTNYTREGQE